MEPSVSSLESGTHRFRRSRGTPNPNASRWPDELGMSPTRARVARVLRTTLPFAVRFDRAAVYLPSPIGAPRLLTGVGESEAPALDAMGPSRLRAAAARAAQARATTPFCMPFDPPSPDVPYAEALVFPIARATLDAPPGERPWTGSLVIYRTGRPFTDEERVQTLAMARILARILDV